MRQVLKHAVARYDVAAVERDVRVVDGVRPGRYDEGVPEADERQAMMMRDVWVGSRYAVIVIGRCMIVSDTRSMCGPTNRATPCTTATPAACIRAIADSVDHFATLSMRCRI